MPVLVFQMLRVIPRVFNDPIGCPNRCHRLRVPPSEESQVVVFFISAIETLSLFDELLPRHVFVNALSDSELVNRVKLHLEDDTERTKRMQSSRELKLVILAMILLHVAVRVNDFKRGHQA